MDWHRLLQLKVFSEDADQGEGPVWAKVLMGVSSFIGGVGGLISIISMMDGHNPGVGGGIFVVGFAVSSGAAWHLNMRGRALNGLILSIAGALLLSVFP